MTTTRKIGFLGCGRIAECVMSGLLNSGYAAPNSLYVCNRTEARMTQLCEKYHVQRATATELVMVCDIVLIGVKPNDMFVVLDLVKEEVNDKKIIISMASGIKIESIESKLPPHSKVIRVMPNVASFVRCGATSIMPNKEVTTDERSLIVDLFNTVGKTVILPESSVHGFIGLCGSSPAYVFMFIEALSDGAVRLGIPRQLSYEMAAQAVLGAAKMLQESHNVPAQLKDMVCSPGGTTIEALSTLERGGFRSLIIEAVSDCAKKSKDMELSEFQ